MDNKNQESQVEILTKFEEDIDSKITFGQDSYTEAFTPLMYYKNMSPYQKRGIEFLINNYKEKKGCILDQEKEMNIFFEIVTFFKCVFNFESLFGIILSSEEQMATWKLYFSKLSNFSVNILNDKEDIKMCNWSKFNIILVNFKLFQFLPVKICKVLILDCADVIINTGLRSFSQNLCCEMRIALTNARIRRISQRKVLWELLKFIDHHQIRNCTLKFFLSECVCNIENLLWFQWNDIYLRLDWTSYKKCEELLDLNDEDIFTDVQSTYSEKNESIDNLKINLNKKSKSLRFYKSSKKEINKSKFKDSTAYFRYFENEFYTPNCYSLQKIISQQSNSGR